MAQATVTLSDILTLVAEKTNKTTEYAAGANTTLKATFVRGINEAYREITKEKYKLDTSESVTLDSDRCFDPASLAKNFYRMKAVYADGITDARGYSFVELQRNKIYVPEAAPSSSVVVSYYYMPADLSDANATSEIPAAVIPAKVYAEYAAFYYFSNVNKFDRANYHYAIFDNAMSDTFTSRTPGRLLVRKMR